MIISDVEELSNGSHKIVEATCDFKLSEKCKKIIKNSYRDMLKYMNNNDGKNICLYCSRKLKYSGFNNPNSKYNFDDTILEDINSHEKAYFLGWIASDGSIKRGTITIEIKNSDLKILEEIIDSLQLNCMTPKKRSNRDTVVWSIYSKKFSKDVCSKLKISPGKKSGCVDIVNLKPDLMWSFLRGYFDGDGYIRKKKANSRYLSCSIFSNSNNMRNTIQSFLQLNNIKCTNSDKRSAIEIYGKNAYSFFDRLYSTTGPKLYRKYQRYLEWRIE